MRTLQEKISAFKEATRESRIFVSIHEQHNKPKESAGHRFELSSFAKKVITYAAILASAAGIIYMHDMAVEGAQERHNRAEQSGPVQYLSPDELHQAEIRQRLNYVEVSYSGRKVLTLDAASRLMLVKDAAENNNLKEAGLSWRDLYGIIHAETTWIPRDGASRDGTLNSGLAQLEPATAKALAVTDPDDPVQAINAAAKLVVMAAGWSNKKIKHLNLPEAKRHDALREGVSVFYNLSVRGRSAWNGNNRHVLPQQTQLHISNTRDGAILAGELDRKLGKMLRHEQATQQDAAFSRDMEPAPMRMREL